MAPLKIDVHGEATIYKPAERAVVTIDVRSDGPAQEEVSQQVIAVTSQLREMLTELAPINSSGEVPAGAPITHWSNSSLSTGYFMRYNEEGKQPIRSFNANTNFQVKFQDFAKLSAFATKLSTMQHVNISNIDWRLTEKTKASLNTQIRENAIQDAVNKARDYAAALGRKKPVATEVSDQESGYAAPYGRQMMVAHRGGVSDDVEMNFNPEEVSVNCSVNVKFECE